MKFKFLNKEISIWNNNKKSDFDQKFFNSINERYWFRYLWSTLWDCWEIKITRQTYYDIHKKNSTIWRYYQEVFRKIGGKWLQIVDKGWKVIEDPELKAEITKFFSIPTFDLLEQQIFTQAFCSGMVVGIIGEENWLWEKKIKILDSRGIVLNSDKYWDVKSLQYYPNNNYSWKSEKINIDDFYSQLYLMDHDNPIYWRSMYEWIVMDALTDWESAKKQLYFFANGAKPDIIIMLDRDVLNSQEKLETYMEMYNNKYKWSHNSHKTLQSTAIKDIKTLDVNNRDIELLWLRQFIDTRIAMVYWIDKRLIWYDKDWSWVWAEIDVVSTTIANSALKNYAKVIDDFMTNSWKKLVDPNFEYKIETLTDYYNNPEKTEKLILDKIKEWVISRLEWRKEMNMWIETNELIDITDGMKKIIIPSNNISIDNI